MKTGRPPSWKRRQLDEALNAYQRGLLPIDIKAMFGIPQTTLHRYRRKRGIPLCDPRIRTVQRQLAQYAICKKTGCWIWTGYKNDLGYGTYGMQHGRTRFAHRIIYELLIGPIPDDKQLDHLCRNPACVNPRHLEVVTCAENVRRGLSTKLTLQKVESIRAEYTSSNISQKALGKKHGVSSSLISMIIRGKIWMTGIPNPVLRLDNRDRIISSRRKLSDSQVARLRIDYSTGHFTFVDLGYKYNISDETARQIVYRATKY